MVHLQALPGSPGFEGSLDRIVETAISDALALTEAGFPALLVENFGDVPFFADRVPPVAIAAITTAVNAISATAPVPFGVNVLRNDGLAALGVAAATDAAFIRINVLTGVMYTDQGPIVGQAANLLRERGAVAPNVEIWADVMVKHATPPTGLDARQAAADTVERGLADAVIVSGSGTGAEPDIHEAMTVRAAIPRETRLVIGSGASAKNLSGLMDVADAVIVGSALKIDGDPNDRVDPARAEAFVKAASNHGLL
jgi:membrane complex biogenesis BtpA family protein